MAPVRMRVAILEALGVCLSAAMLAAGCKTAPPAAPSTPTPAATFTITPEGVSPRSATIALGDRVVFLNSDARTHSMASDPHPDHTDCPNINQVGFLRPGDRRETGNFVTARVCGFHDHDAPNDQTLHGAITIR